MPERSVNYGRPCDACQMMPGLLGGICPKPEMDLSGRCPIRNSVTRVGEPDMTPRITIRDIADGRLLLESLSMYAHTQINNNFRAASMSIALNKESEIRAHMKQAQEIADECSSLAMEIGRELDRIRSDNYTETMTPEPPPASNPE